MNNNQAVDLQENRCEHCNRVFARPNTLLKHICEQKRRWLDKDRVSNRIGYSAWKNYFQTYHPSKKNTECQDFVKSNYFTAFVNFGTYCVDINAINPQAYSIYLLKNKVPIDSWNSDKSYTKYIIEYLKLENWHDAVKRSIETLLDITQKEGIMLSDAFRFVNTNRLCYLIASGKISPWVLYQSATGKEFLAKLDQSQTNLIFEYIDPEKWNIKFKREADSVNEVKILMRSIPL